MNMYCAFTCEARPDWQARTPPPQKPGNVGEKKWLEEKLPEKWKELEEDSKFHFTAGHITKVTVIGDEAPLFEGGAVDFVRFVDMTMRPAGCAPHMELMLFAFDASERMRQTLWTAGADNPEPLPLWLWTGAAENRYNEFDTKFSSQGMMKLRLIDLEGLSGAKNQKIPWGAWVKAWGIQPQTPGAEWTPLHTAEVVRELARRMGYGNRQ